MRNEFVSYPDCYGEGEYCCELVYNAAYLYLTLDVQLIRVTHNPLAP